VVEATTRLTRADFPVLERIAYLNTGSVGPLSVRTHRAVLDAQAADLEQGRARSTRMMGIRPLFDQLRSGLADLLGVPSANLVPTGSTTEGCNIVVSGFPLGPGDEIVTTDSEHPGLSVPLQLSGATLRIARLTGRPAEEALDAVLAEVTPRTRLIALSHVLWLNGQVLPIVEIKQLSGLPLLVDGAQSVGAVRVAAGVADYYTVSGQKWLCGPEGTGALYVADPDSLQPRLGSYAAIFAEDAARLALSFPNPALLAGLAAAVADFPPGAFEAAARMTAHCRTALLEAGLEVLTEPGQGTLVAFRAIGDPAEIVQRAEAQDVVVRSLTNGSVRASCGWWTSDEDIARLIAAVR
jgi:L-cysteine/cystine lyase